MATKPKKKNILVIDVGGTNVKVRDQNHAEAVKIPSGRAMTSQAMAAQVIDATKGWGFTHVAIGYPGPVVDGKPEKEPANVGGGWVGFDFEKAFGCPVRVVNDAAMQALGSYKGGRMLFLGLGTGLGTALIVDGTLAPLELGHLPYRHGKSFEDYTGIHGLERLGRADWRKHVAKISVQLKNAMVADYVVFGGGNARLLKTLPEHMELGNNANAFTGGLRIWEGHSPQTK
jgi:polyphosphate glucokinase